MNQYDKLSSTINSRMSITGAEGKVGHISKIIYLRIQEYRKKNLMSLAVNKAEITAFIQKFTHTQHKV